MSDKKKGQYGEIVDDEPTPTQGLKMGQYGVVVDDEADAKEAAAAKQKRQEPAKTPAPKEEPSFAENFKQGLLTNEKPRGMGGLVGRSVLPAAGSAVGSFTGAVGGLGAGSVPLAVAGATAGAGAGESARQALVSTFNPGDRARMDPADAALDVVKPVVEQAVLGGIGQGAGTAIAKGGKAAFETLGPGVTTLLTKVPAKATEPLIKGQLKGATSSAQAGADYAKATAPLVPLETPIDATPAYFMDTVKAAAAKMKDGTITPQEALWGRQALSKIKEMSKFGQDMYAGSRKEQIALAKELDTYLESSIPGFKEASLGYFKAKSAEKFASWFPRNKDGTVDTARALVAGTTGFVGAPFMSPRIAKATIDITRDAVGPAVAGALKRSPSPLKAALDRYEDPEFLGKPIPTR